MTTAHIALGIDIGGSGVKGAPVDLDKGEMTTERFKIETPQPSTPEAIGEAVRQIAEHFADVIPADAPIGITVPGVVQRGVVRFVGNIDKSWVDFDGDTHFEELIGRPIHLLNDADAAAVAEARYGAAKGQGGLVILTTLGTGIGTGLIHNGVLIPNAELGHLIMDGEKAEARAASSAKDREGLSYEEWATDRLQPYYTYVENLFWPDLFVVGGGVSRKSEKFLPLLDLRTPIVPAELRNNAGIVGAAAMAADYAGG
ncbi:MAG: polyphosphate--glucose phosphotransferase [Dermatophilaceae bacterium]|nr:ROK family protein [Intrasporangiaceae bacterium]